MKKHTIWLLAIMLGITFAGLLYMQVLYMKNIVTLRDEYFSQGVTRSLYEVSRMLERSETKKFLMNDAFQTSGMVPNINMSLNANLSNSYSKLSVSGIDTVISPTNEPFSSAGLQQPVSLRDRIRSQYIYQRALLDEVVIKIISQSGNLPIAERADSTIVSDALKTQLAANGITLPFEFAIVNRMGGIVYNTSGYDSEQSNPNNTFTQALFPNDSRTHLNYIKVYFPDKRDYIFHSIKFLVPSFFLTILFLLLSIYTIIVDFRQKKLTEMKNDFINNMTHEFKTPISSISLAAQMLNDNSVRKSPTMLEHISTVITDETKRLRFQVEKVLQMSIFDRQKATLRIQEIDVNSLINSVVNTFKLKVERYGGSIETKLDAEDPLVAVDEMHFTNVIFNLLDNAVKYRDQERPLNLVLSTRNLSGDKLQITITDNGIGIKKDDLKRVFDKFYRVSTGNRHDVKGFGLGLAYVKKLIKEFHGDIYAESELNKGTKFIIILPLTKL